MKKIVLTFGTISGLIVASMFFITLPFYKNGTLSFEKGQWIGYTSMIIAFSLTFFGIKGYRDQQPDGTISFGTAFKTGLLICLVASGIYVIAWEICLAFFTPDFMDIYTAAQIKRAQSKGVGPDEIAKLNASMQQMAMYYKNPLIRVLITWLEIFPIGAIVALICAVILKRKEPRPA